MLQAAYLTAEESCVMGEYITHIQLCYLAATSGALGAASSHLLYAGAPTATCGLFADQHLSSLLNHKMCGYEV